MEEFAPTPDEGATVATAGVDEGRQGRIDVGILIAHTPQGEPERLRAVAAQMATDAAGEFGSATDAAWRFYAEESAPLPDAADRRPAEFLDEATERMAEGPYDAVVLTDAPVKSIRDRYVPDLASEVSRVVVISTRNFLRTPRGEPKRILDAPAVRWNAATLLLHLVGHILGATHRTTDDSVMAPFRFDSDRRSVPQFDAGVTRHLHRIAREVPEEAERSRSAFRRFAFYAVTAARHPPRSPGPSSRAEHLASAVPPETGDCSADADARHRVQR